MHIFVRPKLQKSEENANVSQTAAYTQNIGATKIMKI